MSNFEVDNFNLLIFSLSGSNIVIIEFPVPKKSFSNRFLVEKRKHAEKIGQGLPGYE
jgi:hypothetical protein